MESVQHVVNHHVSCVPKLFLMLCAITALLDLSQLKSWLTLKNSYYNCIDVKIVTYTWAEVPSMDVMT